MENNILELKNFKKAEFTKINEQFTLAKCYVMALGKNVNRTYFSKEVVDKAYETLNFVPVVGHVMTDDNGNYYLGGHDKKLDLKDFTFKSLCLPYGFVLASNEPKYEEVKEEDGSVSTYLIADVILWTGRYPEIFETFYNEDVYCGQSMEIKFNEGKRLENDEKYYEILDFYFTALCMLCKSDDPKFNVNPCFPNAKIVSSSNVLFSLDENFYHECEQFKKDIAEELKRCNLIEFYEKGGLKMEDEKESKIEEVKQSEKKQEEQENVNEQTVENKKEIDSIENDQTSSNIEEENQIQESVEFSYCERFEKFNFLFQSIPILNDKKVVGEVYYHVIDFDDDYVYVDKYSYYHNGNSENIKIKYHYILKDKNTDEVALDGEEIEVFCRYLTLDEINKLENDKNIFSRYKEEHKYTNKDYEDLLMYKEQKEKEEFNFAINNIIDDYKNDIGNTAEFKSLIENKENYSLDDFEKQCVFIVGLYARKRNKEATFNRNNNLVNIDLNEQNNLNQNEDFDFRDILYEEYNV